MVYLTAGNVFKFGTTSMALVDAQAIQTLLQTGGTYTVVLYNVNGTLHS